MLNLWEIIFLWSLLGVYLIGVIHWYIRLVKVCLEQQREVLGEALKKGDYTGFYAIFWNLAPRAALVWPVAKMSEAKLTVAE